MKGRGFRYGLALSCGLLAVSAGAATLEKQADRPFADADHVVYTLPRGGQRPSLPLKARINKAVFFTQAKVVFIFWGSSFNNAASPDFSYARTLQADRDQFGGTPEWAVLRGYGVQPTSLGSGTPDWFDTTTPPTNVTDSIVQSEVNRYLSSGHGADSSTIYEVVIPRTSYSSSGSSTSCGGRGLAYCAYHGSYNGTSGTVSYSIQPYPSCSGCQVSGWSDVQNQEHFFCHETREAAVYLANSWRDTTTDGPDDKCTWSPTPFIGTNGYAYQYEWSRTLNRCIRQ